MTPLGKDMEFAARMSSMEPSLGPSGSGSATVAISFFFFSFPFLFFFFFLNKASEPAHLPSSILGAEKQAPAVP